MPDSYSISVRIHSALSPEKVRCLRHLSNCTHSLTSTTHANLKRAQNPYFTVSGAPPHPTQAARGPVGWRMAWAVGIEQQFRSSCPQVDCHLSLTSGMRTSRPYGNTPACWRAVMRALGSTGGASRDACSENRSTDRRKGSDLHCKSRCRCCKSESL